MPKCMAIKILREVNMRKKVVERKPYRIREDGLVLTIARSENGVYIQKLGTDEVYVEAIDVETTPYVYVETTKKIKK